MIERKCWKCEHYTRPEGNDAAARCDNKAYKHRFGYPATCKGYRPEPGTDQEEMGQ